MTEHVSGPDADGNFSITYDPPQSNPNYGECGESVQTEGRNVVLYYLEGGSSREQFAKDVPRYVGLLHERAKTHLPPGTVYEIRGKIPTDYGRSLGVAWYHVDAMKDWPVTGVLDWPGEYNKLGGYMRCGTFRT